METLHFTAEEQADFEKESKEVQFRSSLGFLNAHNGLRRGSFHLVLGTTGGGKSTLVRTLLRDFLFKKENDGLSVALWLSEETVRSYKQQLAKSMPSHDILLNAHAQSEQEIINVKELSLFEWLNTLQPDVLIFDNITTSELYEAKKPDEQIRFAKKLKAFTQKTNCATILIAHTSAEITDSVERLLTVNDIRGSKAISNLTEFAYILQRFEVGETFFPTIRIVKHRSQDLVHNLYLLNYDKRIRAFRDDTAIQFDKFKEVFSARNKLK